MYADDSCIIAPSVAGLQKLLNICCDYAVDNTIIYNKTKSKYMCFKPRKLQKLSVPPIYLNGAKLRLVNQVKYLGVHMTACFTDNCDMTRHKR